MNYSTDEHVEKAAQQPKNLLGVVFILALFTFGSMAALLGFMGAEARELDSRALTFITLFGFATIIGVDALMIRFLTMMYHLPVARAGRADRDYQANKVMPPARVPTLEQGLTGMPSVTEHTTRSFERPGQNTTY